MIELRDYQKDLVDSVRDEKWKVVPNFTDYAVSNLGRVKRIRQAYSTMPKILKPWVESGGYHQVELSNNFQKKTYRVHRLVLEVFKRLPVNGEICNHKDGNKQNNHIDNLEWCSSSYNMLHSYKTGLHGKSHGDKSHFAKLTKDQVLKIRSIISSKSQTLQSIADEYNISRYTVYSIRDRESWRNI